MEVEEKDKAVNLDKSSSDLATDVGSNTEFNSGDKAASYRRG
jgi:hypothetical protein